MVPDSDSSTAQAPHRKDIEFEPNTHLLMSAPIKSFIPESRMLQDQGTAWINNKKMFESSPYPRAIYRTCNKEQF